MPDLSRANTEAAVQYQRFHDHHSHMLKVMALGLILFQRAIDEGRTHAEIQEVAYANGGLWGGLPVWRNPRHLIADARQEVGNSGIVRAFSAFDVFLDKLVAGLSAWRGYARAQALIK